MATQQTQSPMHCWWRGCLQALTPRAAAQVAGTQAQEFLKEGDPMKDSRALFHAVFCPVTG